MGDQNIEFRPIDRTQHTVLVVDDDPISRYTTVRWLQAAGFMTREARNGVEGLQEVRDDISAIVLDVHLPDIDGFELCRRLRSRSGTARLPVLHLSAAYVTDEDKVRGLDSGADTYLTHPVDPAVLVASVQALIRARVAEEALRHSESQFKAVFARAPGGIGLLDMQGSFVEANPSMLRFLASSLEQVTGRPLQDFVPADFHGVAEAFAKTSSAADSAAVVQFPVQSADGSVRQLQWEMLPHIQPGLNMILATDVTSQVLLDEQRQQALQRERAARADAERLGRIKEEFIAVLSHELRTPLTTIMGWLHILRKQNSDADQQHRGLEVIERNVALQARLVSDLLDMSSINLGKMRLSLGDVNVPEVLSTVIEASQTVLGEKGLRAELVVRENCPLIRADFPRVQQIASNLINNAIKFSKPGGQIKITVEPRSAGASQGDSASESGKESAGVRFSIADGGAGISPDFLPRLFDRFSQADAGSNRRHGGLGLGLSIVRHLVESHDGTISVDSPGPDKGATFSVWLPTSGPTVDLAAVAEQSVESEHADSEATLAGVSLLVVDDDPEICATLELILRDRGANVRVAHDYDSALAEVRSHRPDALLSDIGMPGKDGYALIQQIRQMEPKAHLPAIAVTSYTREQDQVLALERGFDAHCSKPIRPLELVQTIQRLLRL